MANIHYVAGMKCRNCGVLQDISGSINSDRNVTFSEKCESCSYYNIFKTEDILNGNVQESRLHFIQTSFNKDELDTEYYEMTSDDYDEVNKPKGYNVYELETINAIKGQSTPEEFRGYLKGGIMKYLARYQHKNGIQDLKKMINFANYLYDFVKDDWKK